jgi:hypothetical protein
MQKLFTTSPNGALDALLELVCLRIQLTETQEVAARGHYDAVSDWLARGESPLARLGPHIYPQGSQRLQTTTRPVLQTEFDLDAICCLNTGAGSHPGALYRLLWNRLWEHKVYRQIMARMPRCVRLEYSGDFHLDIAPAVPDHQHGGECILVPDLDANLALDHPANDRWKSTNPRAYATWFEDRCVERLALGEKQARAQVDPLPDQEPIHTKSTLKRSVQLFKRWRDVEYQDRQTLSPPSIILTTLCGHFYRGHALCSDALSVILEDVVRLIESNKTLCLTNPAHPEESICEKWDKRPEAYRDFAQAIREFRNRWSSLLRMRGLHEIEAALESLFGEAPAKWAIRELARRQVILPREKEALRVHVGTGGLGAGLGMLSVRPHTFFGDHVRS